MRFGRWWHSGDRVVLGLEVWGGDLTPGNLRHACSQVAELAQQGDWSSSGASAAWCPARPPVDHRR